MHDTPETFERLGDVAARVVSKLEPLVARPVTLGEIRNAAANGCDTITQVSRIVLECLMLARSEKLHPMQDYFIGCATMALDRYRGTPCEAFKSLRRQLLDTEDEIRGRTA